MRIFIVKVQFHAANKKDFLFHHITAISPFQSFNMLIYFVGVFSLLARFAKNTRFHRFLFLLANKNTYACICLCAHEWNALYAKVQSFQVELVM